MRPRPGRFRLNSSSFVSFDDLAFTKANGYGKLSLALEKPAAQIVLFSPSSAR